MRDFNGTKVMVTPSIIYRSGWAVAAINGGEGGYLHIRSDGMDFVNHANRHLFHWRVLDEEMEHVGADETADGDQIYSGAVPASETHHDVSPEETLGAMRALISFLVACAEADSPESDNFHLFAEEIRGWAEMNSDNLSMILAEIEEEEKL